MLDRCPEGFEELEDGTTFVAAAYVDARREAELVAVFPGLRSEAVEPGWDEAWRRFHHGVQIGPLWVGPPWEAPAEGLTPIVIEPGQAFGTGGHATTRLVLELLLDRSPCSLLDVGCGSGVLAIAAAKLGFGPVAGIDFEQAAVEATRENAAANGVAVDAWLADVRTDELPSAGLVLANLERRLVESVAERLDAQFLIASGYLSSEWPDVGRWERLRRVTADGWAAELLERSRGR